MTAQASLPPETLAAAKPSLVARLRAFKAFLSAWVATCADYYAAAAIYDQLSTLSDAELHRRGLSRDTLARDITRACDRSND